MSIYNVFGVGGEMTGLDFGISPQSLNVCFVPNVAP
jgi:hypothetical protein